MHGHIQQLQAPHDLIAAAWGRTKAPITNQNSIATTPRKQYVLQEEILTDEETISFCATNHPCPRGYCCFFAPPRTLATQWHF